MIIIKIQDGLGNQLFNYAFGRCVSLRLGVQLKLDLTQFSMPREFPFTYKLKYFNIIKDIASNDEISGIRDGKNLIGLKLLQFKMRRRFFPYYRKPYVVEQYYHYDPNVLKIKNNSYLAGLWQSEKYFKDIEDQIREEFTLINKPNEINTKFINMINSVNSISLHHRRREFAQERGKKDNQVLMTQNYYDNALNIIKEKVKDPHIFIFSDEIDWVKNNLHFDLPVIYVEHNTDEETHIEDFRLLSLCKHNIVSTSTFSWWSAWLNNNPEKIVIAPSLWFSGGQYNAKDVVPESWIKVNV